jgi:hypothetical protein
MRKPACQMSISIKIKLGVRPILNKLAMKTKIENIKSFDLKENKRIYKISNKYL